MTRGTVIYKGRGQAGCEVRLCDLDAGRVVAHATSNGAGDFVIDADVPPRPLIVARCVDQAIGLAGCGETHEPSIPLDVTSGGPVWEVEIEIDGTDEVPPGMRLVLDPIEIHHAPEVWLAAVRAPVDGVTRGGFTARPLAQARAVVALQSGVWRLAAQRIVAVAANASEMRPEPSWVTDEAWVDGDEVEVIDRAVTVKVDHPRHIVLHVTAVG